MPAPALERVNATTSGGSWAGNTIYKNGWIESVRIVPATSSTLYDLTFTDGDGFVIYQRKGLKGEHVEHNLNIGTRALVGLAISNATADEAFTFVIYWGPQ